MQAVAYGAIASLPPKLRARASAQLDAGTLSRLTEVMRAWSNGAKLDQASFAEHFLGRAADDPVVEKLRSTVLHADLARSPAELRSAAEELGGAMQAVGLDRWLRFLADAQRRARDPATVAAVERSNQLPDPAKDAIRPVYPIETALGILGARIAGGAAAAARAASGALLRQMMPKAGHQPSTMSQTENAGGASKARAVLLTRSRFGHTFKNHGQDATEFLKNRARVMGQPNGQFLDDQAAARFIEENLDKTKGGPISLPMPEGFPARVINPDGSASPARSIRLVPGGNGVKTAYPEP